MYGPVLRLLLDKRMWTENKEILFAEQEATLKAKIRSILETSGTAFEEEHLTFDASHAIISIVPWDGKVDVQVGRLYYIRLLSRGVNGNNNLGGTGLDITIGS